MGARIIMGSHAKAAGQPANGPTRVGAGTKKPTGMSKKQYKQQWPPELPGRCNHRKKHFQRCSAYPFKGPGADGVHCKRHQRAIGERSGQWKGGTSTGFLRKHMPPRLLERFDSLVNDPELTSVRELLAITGTRLTELLEKIPTRESKEAWDAIEHDMSMLGLKIMECTNEKLTQDMALILDSMREHYKTARMEHHAWNAVHDVIEKSRRLKETERKREEMLQANITSQQAVALFNKLFMLLAEEVTDLGVRRRLGQRLKDLLQHSDQHGMMLGPGVTLHSTED